MVQAAFVRVADIHARAFPDRFQAFEFVDLCCVVFLRFIDVRRAALAILFVGIFVVLIANDGGSGWHRKKVARLTRKTTNNLVLPRDLFPLDIGVTSRPDSTILWSGASTYSQRFLPP